jgi:hypothetical protein
MGGNKNRVREYLVKRAVGAYPGGVLMQQGTLAIRKMRGLLKECGKDV